jgi:hypothetical protein
MTSEFRSRRWLDRYANNFHAWKKEKRVGEICFRRPIGLVEAFFDKDGTQLCGRSDVHSLLNLEVRTCLGLNDVKRRILLAWANLRVQHVLLRAYLKHDPDTGLRQFIVRVPPTSNAALEEATALTVFLDDVYPNGELTDFFEHCINTGRLVLDTKSISRLFVFPLQATNNGTFELTLLQFAGHIAFDGLTTFNWTSQFVHLLNQNHTQLLLQLETFTKPERVKTLLPPAQEDLYRAIPGNIARQRWFWAILRILRHIRKPLPPAFANPLCFAKRPPSCLPLQPKYSKLLDYTPSHQPPLQTGSLRFILSPTSTQRLISLCRAVNASVGAGCFALVAIVMMHLETQLHPHVPLSSRKSFIASFPLNPRPFFEYNSPPDSCMLAFSDGIVLPWLPTDLDLEARFRLLARTSHRELRKYQKRLREPVAGLDTHSLLRLIAAGYLASVEKELGMDVQGEYPMAEVMSEPTCAMSSVGSVKEWLREGMFPLDECDSKDFVADFRSVRQGVRARHNEFLVGCATFGDSRLHFGVSYDKTAMDEEMVKKWQHLMETILEPESQSSL